MNHPTFTAMSPFCAQCAQASFLDRDEVLDVPREIAVDVAGRKGGQSRLIERFSAKM
jgi:hypothetical protein